MIRGRPGVADLPALWSPDGAPVSRAGSQVRVLVRGEVSRDVPDVPEAGGHVVRPADAHLDVRGVQGAPGAGRGRSGETVRR